MKIKSILAAVAAAGTIFAVSASAFAEEPVLVSAPVAEDILIAPAPGSALETEVSAKFKKLFADKISEFTEQIKQAVEAAGGIDSIVDNAMEQIEGKSPEELKAMFAEQLAASSIPEEQVEKIMEMYSSEEAAGTFTPEAYRESITGLLTAIQTEDGTNAMIDAMFLMMDEESLAQMSKALDEYEAGLAAGGDTGKDIATGGENADTGVEGVAAIVGVIAVAGAVVVISRKKA